MTDKFKNVPVEEDTAILYQQEAKLGKYDVLYQKWLWDGITAESIIFANGDVADLHENEITELVYSSPLVNEDSKITFRRTEGGFTFVNFNFQAE